MLGYVLVVTLVLSVLSPFLFTDVFADSFVVNFDKQFFDMGDSLTISGEIMEIGMPVIAMSIYDPDGKIISANNLEISAERTFSKTLILESPVYEKSGEYQIKLEYGKVSENYNFVLGDTLHDSKILVESFEKHMTILFNTEKKQYSDNETVKIRGTVSMLDSPSVLIGIYDPFGMPVGFYFGLIDSNLEFVTDFLVKDGVNFRVDGTYSIKAHYAEVETVSFFEYSKVPPIVVEDVVVEDVVVEDVVVEDVVVEDVVVEDVVVEDVVVEDVVVEDVVVEDVVVEDVVVEDVVVEDVVVEDVVVEDVVVEDVVVEDVVVEDVVVEDVVVEDVVVEDVVVEDVVVEDVVVEDVVVEDVVVEEINNEIKKLNDLSVKDVEMGISLNQINLKCDSSVYTDIISYYDGMGPALYRLCEFSSALNFFNESLLDNPDDVEILVNKGSTLRQLGHFSEAIVYYDYAIDIDPNFLPAKNNKANALANMNNLNSAILLYDEILAKEPHHSIAQKNLMIVLSLIDNHSENSLEPDFQNISYSNLSLSDDVVSIDFKKQKSNDFFDDVGVALSTLGALFDFLN